MRFRPNLFLKFIMLILSVIIVTMLLYGVSYRNSVRVITEQLKTSDLNHLDYFTKEIDNQVSQLASNLYTLNRDSTVRDYEYIHELNHLKDENVVILTVQEKLALQASSSTWENQITLHNPHVGDSLSSGTSSQLDRSLLKDALPNGWVYVPASSPTDTEGMFRLMYTDPIGFQSKPEQANMIFEMRFPAVNIKKMIEGYNYGGTTFLYQPQLGLIHGRTKDPYLNEIKSSLPPLTAGQTQSAVVTIRDNAFLVSMVRSSTLGWYVIHYSPLSQILHPINSSRYSFIVATAALLLLSTVLSLMLYRQVQRPIILLHRSINRMKEGRWSTRIRTRTNVEFSALNEGFNEMASQIQALIEKVYLEQIRAKDAYLKQLQAQINPHFLYNCLFFIKSKANIGDTDAVEAMSLNLGEYYRYVTRMDHSLTTVGQELKLLENYLTIQDLRKQKFEYRIEVPGELWNEQIPRLLIQPLVENSVVHGIEPKISRGNIRIYAEKNDAGMTLFVEDDGAGMTEAQLAALDAKIDSHVRDEGSCGLWNVQQRLKLHYGNASGLTIASSPLGGIRATIRIIQEEDVKNDAASSSR